MAQASPTRVRRKASGRRRAPSHVPSIQNQDTHDVALQQIRTYLKGRSSYDVLPVSYRVIVLDIRLEVKKALECFFHNGVVSAPLWNSETSKFAGMFTVSDIIHLIQHYYRNSSYDYATVDVEQLRLESLRDIEKALNVPPPPLLSIHPLRPLFDACQMLIQTHARRLPLLDQDSETKEEVIVSVLTQYRLLKFIAINCKEISQLHLPLRRLGIGTYVSPTPQNPFHPIATATLSTTVFDVVHMFSERGISAVPIIDEQGVVVNLYETVDVITLLRSGAYQVLDLNIASALNKRSPDFPGVIICSETDSLGTLLSVIRQRRVHRLVVVEGDAPSTASTSPSTVSLPMSPAADAGGSAASEPVEDEKDRRVKGRLVGIITLSDILRYMVGASGIGDNLESGPSLPDTPQAEEPPTA